MSDILARVWQFNIEFSLLLIMVLTARALLRNTTKNYNAYLLWACLPLGLLAGAIITQIEVSADAGAVVRAITQNNLQSPIRDYVIQPTTSLINWSPWAIYLWFATSILLLIRLLFQHLELRRQLRSIAVSEQSTTRSLRSRYQIVQVDKPNFSPAVYGFLRPRIYFPIQLLNELNRCQIDLIIQHEEHHISQKHLWLNLLWDITVCAMWFNPIVYISRQKFRHDQEMYCDSLVLNQSSPDSQKSYGHALLSTISTTHSVSLLCSWKSFNQLEERIMNIKQINKLGQTKALLLLGAFVVSSTSLYAANAGESGDSSEKKQIKVVKMKGDGEKAEKHIKLKMNDKQFVEKDGKRYVIEGDDKRPMTAEENAQFDKHVGDAQKHMKVVKSGKKHGHKEGAHQVKIIKKGDSEMHSSHPEGKQIRIIKHVDADNIEDIDIEALVEQAEAMAAGEMRHIEIEMEKAHEASSQAEREIAMAIKELEAAHASEQISKQEMKKAHKELAKAKETLEKDRIRAEKSAEKAQAEAERIRKSLKEQH